MPDKPESEARELIADGRDMLEMLRNLTARLEVHTDRLERELVRQKNRELRDGR